MGLLITLLLAGAILLALETIIPGLIVGIIGAGCLIAAVVVAYVQFGTSAGNIVLVCVSVGLVIGALVWMHFLPQSPFGRLFISHRVIGNIDAEQPELLGLTGKAISALRPSGMALINDRRIDVVTEGMMIDPGTPIKVVAIEGMRVVVRALDPQPNPTTSPTSA